MVPVQNIRARVALVAQTVGTATANVYGNVIDASGFDSATFIIESRAATVTSKPDRVIIEHSDSTDTATFVAVATISSGLPTQVNDTAVTQQATYGVVNVDLRGKRRYLRLGLRGDSTHAMTASSICLLDLPAAAPTNATAAGTLFFRAVG